MTASGMAGREGTAGAAADRAAAPGPAGVVLIHGLARGAASMWLLARRLEAAGFRAAAIPYPSRRLTIDQAVDWIAARLGPATRGWGVVHLVGHSLGGVIARRLAERRADPRIGRVVQLGAPNSGSHMALIVRRLPLARWLLGPALDEIPALAPPRARVGAVGAIAGVLPPMGRRGLALPGDGFVTVRSAWRGAEAHQALLSLHGWLPLSARAAREIVTFLQAGRFGLGPGQGKGAGA